MQSAGLATSREAGECLCMSGGNDEVADNWRIVTRNRQTYYVEKVQKKGGRTTNEEGCPGKF